MKKTSYWISVAIIGTILGFSLQLVQAAWTEPTAAPPGGSTAGAPINTGAVAQNKVGSLGTSGSLSAAGAVSGSQLCIGSDCRASWPSVPPLSCPCGTCWNSRGPGDMCNGGSADIEMCTPAGWVRTGIVAQPSNCTN